MGYTGVVRFGLSTLGSLYGLSLPPDSFHFSIMTILALFSIKFSIFLDNLQGDMSSSSFTDIHVRDFVHEVRPDPTRPGYDSALQLHSEVNIPPVQGEELSDDIDVKPVPTLIRFFVTNGQADLFQSGVFVYVRGPFYVDGEQDGYPQLVVNAFSVDW